MVSRKVGKAVVRNRVRRRLRESLRLMLQATPAGAVGSGPDGRWPRAFDALVIVRPSGAEADFAELASGLRRALDAASAGVAPDGGGPTAVGPTDRAATA